MPSYPGALHGVTQLTDAGGFPPFAISPGDKSNNLFNAEQPAAPQASDRVGLTGVYENHPGTLSVEGFFSGNPGAFEIDLQTADTDADGFYAQEGAGVTVLTDATANTFRGEFLQITARFARVLLKTRTNAVNLTVWVVRK